jgi:hypothetical protein
MDFYFSIIMDSTYAGSIPLQCVFTRLLFKGSQVPSKPLDVTLVGLQAF